MSIFLPLLGIALAALAAWLGRTDLPPEPVNRFKYPGALVALVVLFAAFAAGIFRFAPEIDRVWMLLGSGMGVAAALLGLLASRSLGVSAAWGIAIAIVCQTLPEYARPSTQIALLASAGIAGALVGGRAAGLGALAVVAADFMGRLAGGSETLPMAGSVFGLVAIITVIVGQLQPSKPALKIAAAFIPIALGYALGQFWLKDSSLGGMLAMGAVSGLVLNFLVPSDGEPVPTLNVGVAAVISVSLASVAFALGRGTGMAHTFFAGFAVLAMFGNTRAMLTLGPLASLVLFRIFRVEHPELSRAFDIGQHYAVIGILIGLLVPLIFVDWLGRSGKDIKGSVAAGLWGVLLLGLVPVLMVFLGAFGTVGFIIGAGIAGLIESLRKGSSIEALSLGTGLAGLTLGIYGWLSASLDLARDEKVVILGWSAAVVALLSLGIFLLSGRLNRTADESK